MEEQSKNNGDFLNNLSQLPSHVHDWIFSYEIGENCIKIAKKFNLKQEQISLLAKITSYVIEKIVPLEKLPEALEKSLGVNKETAQQISIEVAIEQFLPIRDYLIDTENFIKSLGGQLPSVLPPIIETRLRTEEEKSQSDTSSLEPEKIIEKDIASAIAEHESVAHQNISEKPLKFVDSENLKLPSIKNWITDYKKFRTNFPNQDLPLVRGKYLYESPNAKNLNDSERLILAHILKSLDEYIKLPFSQETGRLLVGKLIQAPILPLAESDPTRTWSPPSTPPRSTSPSVLSTLNPSPAPPAQKDTYREQFAQEDLAKPQVPPRPEPKLNGNIVDLKNFGGNQP